MYQYIIIFLVTTLLMKYAQNKNKIVKSVCALVSIMIIAIFSAMRDLSVGTDTESYYREFLRAQHRIGNFKALILVDNIYDIEFSFELVAYMCAYLKNGFQLLLFFYSFLTHAFIYMGIRNEYKNNNKITMWIPWICYCLLFYNCTLNNMRQWLSIAIIFFIYSDKNNIKINRVIFYTVLSFIFHKAAIFNLFIYLVYIVCKSNKKKYSIFNTGMIFILCSLPFVFPRLISYIIVNFISGYNSRYNGFIMGNSANTSVVVDWISFFFRIFFLIFIIYLYNNYRKKNNFNIVFDLCCMFIDTFFALQYNQLNLRLCNFFSIMELHNIPLSISVFNKNKTSQRIAKFIVVFMASLYWLVKYIIWNNNETHPYVFYGI